MSNLRISAATLIVAALSAVLSAAEPSHAPTTATTPSPAPRPFAIEVVDDQTGRGVPLVELKTDSNVRYYTDSHGLAAIDDPALIGHRVFFAVTSHGYEFPADGFGSRGRAIDVTPGGSVQFKVK